MNYTLLNSIIFVYVAMIALMGYLGYRSTQSAGDYILAGGNVNPFVMAMSYGAAFISTSAIIGFGGAAGVFGMGLLWLTFFTIFVGVFIAFVFFGKRTRTMGNNLNAMTLPELMGKRYNSSFIHMFSAMIIFIFMPLYAGAVLIGAARFLETALNLNYTTSLIIFTALIAVYVTTGGIKGVMYSDALQGSIMFFGMVFLLIFTYMKLGGVTEAHSALSDMAAMVPEKLKAMGHQGWTQMPVFGSNLWWVLVSTLIMGVGIGTLAQPQLAVKFMTVKSGKSLNRACLVGGVFIFAMTGVAFIVGALSNVHFMNTEGKTALAAVAGNFDKIIPLYIKSAMPEWFAYVFMVTLLAAGISTLSNLFHSMGTALGKDIYEQISKKKSTASTSKHTILFVRIGIVIGIIMSLILGYQLPISIVARATAMFFGIAAAAFLPMFMLGIYWKGITRAGATAGMVVGTFSALFWLFFVHAKEAAPLGICKALFGKPFLISADPWPVVDPILIGLPISLVVTVIVSLLSRPLEKEHIAHCFESI